MKETIGKKSFVFRSELMERYPLLNEIAVIDSGSTDQTREISAEYGLMSIWLKTSYPREVTRRQGENLWKAIYELSGDIICYVDSDIKNPGLFTDSSPSSCRTTLNT